MAISDAQKRMVQRSFELVEPIAEEAADIFYNRLFYYEPSVKALFKGDIKAQGKMLMSTLKIAIKGLDDLNSLIPVLHKLAERHVDYGVKAEHFTPVGNALLYTLKKGLGEEWTPELREAWIEVFRTVANVMKEHSFND